VNRDRVVTVEGIGWFIEIGSAYLDFGLAALEERRVVSRDPLVAVVSSVAGRVRPSRMGAQFALFDVREIVSVSIVSERIGRDPLSRYVSD